MSLRAKLTLGLGFLFLIIFALAIYSSFAIQGLSRSANKILKDNYASLVYCKNMLLALDDMRIAASGKEAGRTTAGDFAASKSDFEKNLAAENGNITEMHETEYVEELHHNYGLFLTLLLSTHEAGRRFIPAYLDARRIIVKINDLNMEAIERKSLSTKHESSSIIASIAAAGAACILLAFFYFWYFPVYVSSSLSFLAMKAKTLLDNLGIKLDTRNKDETLMLLKSIDLLEARLLEKSTLN